MHVTVMYFICHECDYYYIQILLYIHGLIATADFVCPTFVYKLLSYALMEQVGGMVAIFFFTSI